MVVAEGQQFEFLEEVQKELVGAVQQLLRGWVGQQGGSLWGNCGLSC